MKNGILEKDKMNEFIALTYFQDAMYALTKEGKLFKLYKDHIYDEFVCVEVMRLPS